MKIAIFGGSFDPVHAEHVNMARAAQEALGADKFIAVPAYLAPHKHGAAASAEDRLAMARIAFSGIKNGEVSAYECNAGGVSYTYLTLGYFRRRYPEAELFLLVGSDMLRDFYTWREPETILSLAELVVCYREGDAPLKGEQLRFAMKFKKRFRLLPYTGRDISSTKARVLCALGEDVRPFLPEGVIEYIEARELYRIDGVKAALKYLKTARRKHTVRVALLAAELARRNGCPEGKLVQAAAMHDAAKNLPLTASELAGFVPPEGIPAPVLHQFTGAYLAEHTFGVQDAEVLDAIRYHTTGRPNMGTAEKIVFLADMLEAGRDFPHVQKLRACLAEESLDECMYRCLKHQVKYLKKGGGEVCPLTLQAYDYYTRLHAAKKNG